MNSFFEDVKKNFGFGCMRLPMNGSEVDFVKFSEMIDYFIESGFNYFDTAHMYVDGKSESALKKCLTNRYKRESFILTDKLSAPYFKSEADIRPFFESQLKVCGVEYFDFYLMHAQNSELFAKFKRCNAYETALKLKDEGRIRHFGISFHDKACVLEEILKAYPQIEVVQIQFNYLDYENPAVEGRLCYEVCRKYNKPIIVMEPVKGGSLVNIPQEAKEIFDSLSGGSAASYAIRFAAGFDGIFMVLSGMSDMEQMRDNIGFMKEFKPLGETELTAIDKVCGIIRKKNMIPCTACRYCTDGCPKQIKIPDLFACMNAKKVFSDWNSEFYYREVHTTKGNKASDCIKCGKCEEACPQHLKIRELLETVAKEFEN